MHAAGDVGLARIMEATHLATGLAPCGTFAYAAPEMLMGMRCSEKVVSAVCYAYPSAFQNALAYLCFNQLKRCGCFGWASG